jgi:hypothetical protein
MSSILVRHPVETKPPAPRAGGFGLTSLFPSFGRDSIGLLRPKRMKDLVRAENLIRSAELERRTSRRGGVPPWCDRYWPVLLVSRILRIRCQIIDGRFSSFKTFVQVTRPDDVFGTHNPGPEVYDGLPHRFHRTISTPAPFCDSDCRFAHGATVHHRASHESRVEFCADLKP